MLVEHDRTRTPLGVVVRLLLFFGEATEWFGERARELAPLAPSIVETALVKAWQVKDPSTPW